MDYSIWGVAFSAISAGAAAISAFFSYRSIRENRKNVFLLEKNRVAVSARQIKLDFDTEWLDYKISDHKDDEGNLLTSKYFTDPVLYKKFTSVLVKLWKMEKMQSAGKADEEIADKIASELNAIVCDSRIDQLP